jgi:hypothetical protein
VRLVPSRLLALGVAAILGGPLVAQPRPTGTVDLPKAPAYDSSIVQGFQWRLIGPFRGGRANAVTGVSTQPFVYYAGYTGGGVWKTENAGASWRNISDGFI